MKSIRQVTISLSINDSSVKSFPSIIRRIRPGSTLLIPIKEAAINKFSPETSELGSGFMTITFVNPSKA